MVTAHATVASAVEAMRHGAFDYIEKPFDADQLEQLVARALEHGRVLDQRSPVRSAGQQPTAMIGSSRLMQSLRTRIAQVAPTRETVLITGESGTGKELVARGCTPPAIGRESPLVSLNCPALSAHLMESELFGHERGAFTGAENARTGRFELADSGTILLDEVTEIELSLQAKLLRVLQERSFERVGSSQTMLVDVRVLATTNRDLPAEVAAGRFRADLFYRLTVVPLVVPPLRDRPRRLARVGRLTFSGKPPQRLQKEPCTLEPRRARAAAGISLAGQCPRTGKHHHAGQRAGHRTGHRRRRTAALVDPGRRDSQRRQPTRPSRWACGWKTWNAR